MPVLVKICGLRERGTLEVALDAGADFVGFVFFPKSPRHLSLEEARELGRVVEGRAQKVALLVDASLQEIESIVRHLEPDLLQCHGHEDVTRLEEMRQAFHLPLMKAVALSSSLDIERAHAYLPFVDRLLFDARPPSGSDLPGGNGLMFDWTLLEAYQASKPWMLSGGLTPENVTQALHITKAPGVDVSSGVEVAPGVKDPHRLRAFIEKVRNKI